MSILQALAHEPDQRKFPSGATIFLEGDSGHCMFAVVEGTVEIRVRDRVAEQVGPGGIFGEMAIIDGQPRSADAVAATECTVAAIEERRFLRLIEQLPHFALQVMRIVCERLRRQNGH